MKVEKDKGVFITKDELKTGDFIKFTGEGEIVDGQYGPKLVMPVTLGDDNTERKLSLNPTSKANMIDDYGEDTKDWIGKEGRIFKMETMIAGEATDVIYVTHPNRNLKGEEVNQ